MRLGNNLRNLGWNPYVCMGITLAVFSNEGKMQEGKEILNISDR